MSKSVLISIQPKWCELIASGIKTVEVRKTKPKIETPFKVYIYETNWKDNSYYKVFHKETIGKVIGEFVCDEIECFTTDYRADDNQNERISKQSCVPMIDLMDYESTSHCLYGWHISNLKIYDKPKELSEFATICEGLKPYQCDKCEYSYTESNESIGTYHECCCNNMKPLKRPPQSWCYIEGVDDEKS
jgi:predicted transcriptional regulator